MTIGRDVRKPSWMILAIVTAACGIVTIAGSCRRDGRADSTAPASVLRVGVSQLSKTSPVDGLRQLSQNVSVEGLVRPGEDGRLQPWLAESWTTAADGRSLQVRIKPDAKFHDGSPFDAQAVAALLPSALRAYMGPAAPADLKVDVSGPRIVEIRFPEAGPFLMEALENPLRKPGASVIGTGPFMTIPGSTSELRGNKDYYLGAPQIDRITIESYPSVRAAWAEMLRNNIDMLYDVGLDALDSMETATNVAVFTFTRKYQYFIALNAHSPRLRSPRFRQALSMAVDPASVIRVALNGHALVSTGPFWMRHWALRADLPWFKYDPEGAATMLLGDKLPVARGHTRFSFSLAVPPDAIYERMALELKRELAEVGVELNVEQVTVDKIPDALKSPAFDGVLLEGVSGATLFRPFQLWHSGGVFNPGLGNASVDVAFDRLRAARSEDDFKTAAAAVQQAFMDDPPAIFLGWPARARAVSRRFKVATDPGRPDILGTMRLWTPAAAAERRASRTDGS